MGKYSLRQVLNYTMQSRFKTRFRNMNRDNLKNVVMKKIKSFNINDLKQNPIIKYQFTTFSYPQYGKFLYIKGKKSKSQRKIKHFYDTIFELDELSLSTKNWKTYVGSHRDIPKSVPQNVLKSTNHQTLEKFKKQALKKFDKIKDQKNYIKEQRDKKNKYGVYLDQGDLISRKYGINCDWRYRQEYVYFKNNHGYGRNAAKSPPNETNKNHTMFFNKHQLSILEFLLKKGILKK